MKILSTGSNWKFLCPACGVHYLPKGAGWVFDGNVNSPTIAPALVEVVNSPAHPDYIEGEPTSVCSLTVTAGQITFHEDCTHELAGQTVAMEDW